MINTGNLSGCCAFEIAAHLPPFRATVSSRQSLPYCNIDYVFTIPCDFMYETGYGWTSQQNKQIDYFSTSNFVFFFTVSFMSLFCQFVIVGFV